MATPEEPKMTLTLKEDMIKGVKDVGLDDKMTIALNIKITEVGREEYTKGKPIRVRAEVLSGKILDSKVKDDIDEAKNLKDLDKVTKTVPRED